MNANTGPEFVAVKRDGAELEPESVALGHSPSKSEPESIAINHAVSAKTVDHRVAKQVSKPEPESVALSNSSSRAGSKSEPESVAINNASGDGDSDGGGIALPSEISAANYQACQKVLMPLSVQQRELTLQVFGSMAKAGRVRKPAGLLITLAKAAQGGTLIVPDSVSGFRAGSRFGSGFDSAGREGNVPLHPSHIPIEASDSSARAIEQSSDLAFMQMQARLQGKPLEDIALLYGKADLLKEVQHG